jgi:hypothetical protein
MKATKKEMYDTLERMNELLNDAMNVALSYKVNFDKDDAKIDRCIRFLSKKLLEIDSEKQNFE